MATVQLTFGLIYKIDRDKYKNHQGLQIIIEKSSIDTTMTLKILSFMKIERKNRSNKLKTAIHLNALPGGFVAMLM